MGIINNPINKRIPTKDSHLLCGTGNILVAFVSNLFVATIMKRHSTIKPTAMAMMGKWLIEAHTSFGFDKYFKGVESSLEPQALNNPMSVNNNNKTTGIKTEVYVL